MARQSWYDGNMLPAVGRVRMRNTPGFVSVAERGSINESGVEIDVAAGDFATTGFRPYAELETACVERSSIFRGFIGPRTQERATDKRPSFRTDAARLEDASLYDLNLIFTLRVIYLGEGKRPPEWDYERRDWIMGSRWLTGLIFDNGFVSDDEPAFLDEADYRGMTAYDVLADCVNARFGKNFFAYWDEAADPGEEVSLFYGPMNSTLWTSDIRLSNVLSDQDGDPADIATLTYDVTGPGGSAQLKRTPEDVYSGVYLIYNGGSIYRENPDVAADFIRRDLYVNNPRISRRTTAESIVAQLLARHSGEDDSITCHVRLPKEKAGWIAAGMRIEAKFSHLDGYEDFQFLRIRQCVAIPDAGDNRDWWDFELELVGAAPVGSGGPGGGGPGGGGNPPGPFVPPGIDSCDDLVVQVSNTFTFDAPTAAGNYVLAMCANRNGDAPGAPWTEIAHAAIHITGTDHDSFVWVYQRPVDPGTTVYTMPAGSVGAVIEWGGPVTVLDTAIVESVPADGHSEFGGSVTTTGPAVIFGIAGYATFDADPMDDGIADEGTVFVNQQGGAGVSPRAMGIWLTSTGGSVQLGAAIGAPGESGGFPGDPHHSAITIALECVVDEVPGGIPAPGQETCQQVTSDGTTALYTMPDPYLENSISARVGGSVLTPITQTDPAAGEVTLQVVPPIGTVVQFTYQAGAGPATGTARTACSTVQLIPPGSLGSGAAPCTVLHADSTWGPVTECDVRYIFRTKFDGGKEWATVIPDATDALTIDIAASNNFDVTLTEDCDISLTGAVASEGGHNVWCDILVMLRQDGTGGWAPTFTDDIVWIGGTPPTFPTDPDEAVLLGFLTMDGGTTWIGGSKSSLTADDIRDAGRWELAVVPGAPPDSLYADGDWLYIWVPGP